jgi:shikimate 5-dehydrogenase
MAIRWAEISDQPQPERLAAVSSALKSAGVDNEFVEIAAGEADFADVLERAKSEFDQIRIGGSLRDLVPSVSIRFSSSLLAIKSADALVQTKDGWWPRNFLSEGIHRSIVLDMQDIDLSAAVFILGATPDARAAASALSKVGFSRFTISDPDEARGQSLVGELESSYFKVQFQFIPKYLITQLPKTHSIAVNTLVKGRDQGTLADLIYFNFLEIGGVWLDFAINPPNPDLLVEAEAMGAVIELGARVLARTDLLWAEACFPNLDPSVFAEALQAP